MLAFTMQFSKHERTPTHNHHQHQTPAEQTTKKPDAVWRPDRPARQNTGPPTERTRSQAA
jgi:hypothetical protein